MIYAAFASGTQWNWNLITPPNSSRPLTQWNATYACMSQSLTVCVCVCVSVRIYNMYINLFAEPTDRQSNRKATRPSIARSLATHLLVCEYICRSLCFRLGAHVTQCWAIDLLLAISRICSQDMLGICYSCPSHQTFDIDYRKSISGACHMLICPVYGPASFVRTFFVLPALFLSLLEGESTEVPGVASLCLSINSRFRL